MADCTVIATAVALPRRMHVLRRMFPLQVELPASGAEARAAAAFRAIQALGVEGTPRLRDAVAGRVLEGAGNLLNPVNAATIARMTVCTGLT